jgi:single-stranded-DNA-specific exonuclease
MVPDLQDGQGRAQTTGGTRVIAPPSDIALLSSFNRSIWRREANPFHKDRHFEGACIDQALSATHEMLLASSFVCPHTDADGLAAGALALHVRGEAASAARLLPRGATPFDPDPLPPARPAVILDWGIRPFRGAALFVDHHAPEAEPASDQLVISGYGAKPEVSSSVLTGRIVPDAAAPWVVAVGAVGDLGDRAWVLPDLAGVTRSHVRELVPLINAPRRLPDGPVREALEVLLENPHARAALADPRILLLRSARDEWRLGFKRALRIAPKIAGGVAVIEFSSPYQIHPLVAQTWSRRLAGNVVIAANLDYIPGKVNFAARGGSGDLRSLLRSALPEQEGEFAHGHDRATGGSITLEAFESMIKALREPS